MPPGDRCETDLALAQAAASGDQQANRIIAERLFDRVRTTVQYLSANHRDQDDWVQLALVEILRSLKSFRGESTIEAWGNRIAVRVAMRQMKRIKKQERTVVLDPITDFNAAPISGDEQQRIHIRRRLAQLLGDLSAERRTAIVLKLVYGHSVAEIAEMTDAPFDTVRNRLRRGRKLLRKKVATDPVFSDWVKSRIP